MLLDETLADSFPEWRLIHVLSVKSQILLGIRNRHSRFCMDLDINNFKFYLYSEKQ